MKSFIEGKSFVIVTAAQCRASEIPEPDSRHCLSGHARNCEFAR
jgi:hypothetical protein